MNTVQANVTVHKGGPLQGHIVSHDPFIIGPDDQILVTGAAGPAASRLIRCPLP